MLSGAALEHATQALRFLARPQGVPDGGADANENAFRMARLFTGRDKVLSTYRSYHGNTGGAVVATGDWRVA